MATIDMTKIDEGKLGAFMGQAVVDMATTISGPLLLIGEKLGLFRAMVGAGPLTSADVADKAGVSERYTREWLRGQAAGGYVEYDGASDRYTLPMSMRSHWRFRTARSTFSGCTAQSPPSSPTWTSSLSASGPARALAGTSTTRGCSAGLSASSVLDTPPTWYRNGSQPWTGSWKS